MWILSKLKKFSKKNLPVQLFYSGIRQAPKSDEALQPILIKGVSMLIEKNIMDNKVDPAIQVRLGLNSVGWRKSDVERWIHSRFESSRQNQNLERQLNLLGGAHE